MRFALLMLLALAGAAAQVRAQSDSPQVDQAEVLRLGDTVQHVGDRGAAAEPADAFVAAMSPPESDADKWFISVLEMRGCAACAQLERDWATDEWLLALAVPGEPEKSWAHFRKYDKDDASQQFRWEGIKVSAFPTILVQPPRSGRYGEAATVVYQGVYQGEPQRLARGISTAIRRYVARLEATRSAGELGPIGQTAADPPWQPAPRVTPGGPKPDGPFPLLDPNIPPVPAETPAAAFPWTAVLTAAFAGFTVPTAVALAAWVLMLVRERRRAARQPLLLDQPSFDALLALLQQWAGQQRPTSSSGA